jgi:hypothetical protein
VHGALAVRQTDRLIVAHLCVQDPVLDTRDLGKDQRIPVGEIGGAVLRPCGKLLLVRFERGGMQDFSFGR